MARAANTGVTELFDSRTRASAVAVVVRAGARGRVALSDELSLYVRYTDYFPRVCVAHAPMLTVSLARYAGQACGVVPAARSRRRSARRISSIRSSVETGESL